MSTKSPENLTISVRIPVALADRIDDQEGDRAPFLRRAITNELNRTNDLERFAHLGKQILLLADKIDELKKEIKKGGDNERI